MDPNKPALFIPPSSRRIRVIVADPYPVIVLGIRKMIEDDPHFEVVADASTMASFRRKVILGRPEVALVDWTMASRDSAASKELMKSDLHTTLVIFLTVSENSEQKREMVKLGACGFLSKWTSARTLQKAVYKACNRNRPDEPASADAKLAHGLPVPPCAGSEPESIKQLTYRERHLLPLVCGGLKNKEIALRLGIAETTVWHHLTSIFTKLGVDDRLGLAAFVYRHRLVFSEDLSTGTSSEPSNREGQTLRNRGGAVRRKPFEPLPISAMNRPPASHWPNGEQREHRLTGF